MPFLLLKILHKYLEFLKPLNYQVYNFYTVTAIYYEKIKNVD